MYIGDAICKYLETRLDDELYNKIIDALDKNGIKDKDGNIDLQEIRMPIDKKIEFEYLVNGRSHYNPIEYYSEYPHLIALETTYKYGLNIKRWSKGGFYWKNLKNKYTDYFSKFLSESEIEELLDLHMDLDNENRLVEVDDYSSKIELIWLLECIPKENNLLKQCKIISKRIGLNLRQSIHFERLYHESRLLKELVYHTYLTIDEDMIKKIKYLASSNKVKVPLTFEFLKEIPYDKLISLETMSFRKRINQRGGPKSTVIGNTPENQTPACFTGKHPSQGREIRCIYPNGSAYALSFDDRYRHEVATLMLYNSSPEITEEYRKMTIANPKNATARNIAFLAAYEKKAITLIIEGNYCMIYVPENITRKQFEKYKEILKDGPNGTFGICVCHPNFTNELLTNKEDGSAELNNENAIELLSTMQDETSNINDDTVTSSIKI